MTFINPKTALRNRNSRSRLCPYRVCVKSGGLRRVAYDEVERAGGDLSEAVVAVERDGDADRRVLTCELKPAFEQSVVNLVHVERAARLAQKHCGRVRNRALEEAVALGFCVGAYGRDGVTEDRLARRQSVSGGVSGVRRLCGAGSVDHCVA